MELHGIKAFSEGQIDSAILDVASVICAGDGPLKPVFINMIGGNLSMLKKVDNMSYEDGMGITAWVGGQQVLIGNAQLLLSHGVDTPSKDFESRYRQNGKEILYLSNSGELTAMFVLSYQPDMQRWPRSLGILNAGIWRWWCTPPTQPHSAENFRAVRLSGRSHIKAVPAKLFDAYEALTGVQAQAPAYASYSGHAMGLFGILQALPASNRRLLMGVVLKPGGHGDRYTMVTFFAFMGAWVPPRLWRLWCFQLFWVLAAMVVPNLKRL